MSNFKFIDLFCGIGGFHQALNKLGGQCVFACDIDKNCKEVYENNYNIKPHGDITKIKETDIPDCDIICGGFPCFIAGTKVLTNDGYKNIEEVVLKDTLMTHTGNFKKIINLQRKSYIGDLYSIKIKYHPNNIKCTSEHPFYIRVKTRKWNNKLRKYEYTFKEPEWKKAYELDNNHYFGMKINENNIIPEFCFDKIINQHKTEVVKIKLDNPDMWFMMGYFIGDGWIEETLKSDGRSMNKIRFAINTTDEEYVINRIKNVLNITDKKCPSGNKCNKYGCADFVWFNIFKKFGKYAHGKIIPEWVQDAPKEYIREFINGYHTADGCIYKNRYSFATVSYNLAFGLQRLYLKLGHLFGINKIIRSKTTIIEGRTVNQRDTYQVEGYTRENSRKFYSFIENGYVWYAPFKIEKEHIENEPVYNFEVEDDNSYVVENTLVHNCTSFSNAGKKGNLDDSRGQLFLEIIRIAKEKQPKFLILENVKHIKKIDNGKTFEYICKTINDNGYYVKDNETVFEISPHQLGIPQQRERVIFVCIRKDIYESKNIIKLNIPNKVKIDINKIIDKNSSDEFKIKKEIEDVLNAWDEIINKFEIGQKMSPTILCHEFYRKYTEEEYKNLPKWKQEYIEKNKPIYNKYKIEWDNWYKKYKQLLTRKEIYGKLEWQAGPKKEGCSIWNQFIQFRQSGIRVKKTQYFPTLVAIVQTPIIGTEKRYLTPRECARLQSFPDNFILDTNNQKAYKQFGNAVNVDVVYTVAKELFQAYSNII